MANKIVKTDYPKNPNIITVADTVAVSFGAVIANTGISADSDGKKIIKAGTPVAGDLTARNTAFVKDLETAPVGVVLHDVDVTAGNANGAVLVFGFVDIDKLDSAVVTELTSTVKALLPKITFIKGI